MLKKQLTAPVKPARLKKGEKIGVVAPAGSVQDEKLRAGVDALARAGFAVELAEGIHESKGYLAGEAERRAAALEGFFAREDIRAIFCARGGFGSVQLLSLLNPKTVRLHPKIFVGYSDVSILLNWMVEQCGLVAFHGPMVAMELARGMKEQTQDFFWGTLTGAKAEWRARLGKMVRAGTAEGEVVGGCLSSVVTTLGTPYAIQTKGKILFLEDVGEKPYRIERMLTHLKMAGRLDGLAGLLFGNFTDCEGEGERSVKTIIDELFRDAPYPVATGLAAGHGEENLLIPFGVRMALDGRAGALSLLEPPVL